MIKSRYLLMVSFLVAAAVSLKAQNCTWTTAANQITEICGKVGIGIDSPTSPLHVLDYGDGTLGVQSSHIVTVEQNTTQNDYAAWLASRGTVQAGVTNSGKLFGARIDAFSDGPGVLNEAIGLSIFSGILTGSGTVNSAYGQKVFVFKGSGSVANGYGVYVNSIDATNGYGLYVADLGAANAWGVYQSGTDDLNFFAGKVGIGTTSPGNYLLDVNGAAHFSGSVTVDGNIAAKYQDVAEWVPATSDMPAGTVVVLNSSRANEVMPSSRAYDTAVAGVVSAQPGLILGVAGESKEQIATTGRVRVRVDATAAPIHIGDLLVSSNKPGTAMKSQPVEIGGTSMHRPGTIIGKALEDLPGGEGEILVLLSLQ